MHDPDRPHPHVVTPGKEPGAAPSDAIVLFDGKDLSKWAQHGRGADSAKLVDPQWKVENGYFEVVPGTGDLFTREKFGDCQLHVEWSELPDVKGTSQARGNSGVLLMSRYEIQVLDPYNNPTYADGQASAIYGQFPPLVNPGRKPGEWQTYDIVFEAPRFEGERLLKPAVVHRVLQRRAGSQPQGTDRRHGLPAGGEVHAARSRGAAHVAGTPRSRALPQHLDSPPGRLRSPGKIEMLRPLLF